MSELKVDQIHHVAYRCIDAKATVEWYTKKPEYGLCAGMMIGAMFVAPLCWCPVLLDHYSLA